MLPQEKVLNILREEGATKIDPQCVAILEELLAADAIRKAIRRAPRVVSFLVPRAFRCQRASLVAVAERTTNEFAMPSTVCGFYRVGAKYGARGVNPGLRISR